MLEDIIGQYHSCDLSQEKLNSLKEKLSQLPEKSTLTTILIQFQVLLT